MGSYAYVEDRRNDPNEPQWLGVIQHDQILYDHGVGNAHNLNVQNPNADSDIEYQRSSTFWRQSLELGNLLKGGNEEFSVTYPAEVTDDMCCTDSYPFRDECPAVSIRENRRRSEMTNQAAPHWHQTTDVYSTYKEFDFQFGMDIVRMTAGTVAQLAGTRYSNNGDSILVR